jgi:hypothetical protein
VDGVDVCASGLQPTTTYTLFLRVGDAAAWPLATVITDASGIATLVESIAPTVLPDRSRFILVHGTRPDDPVVAAERQ